MASHSPEDSTRGHGILRLAERLLPWAAFIVAMLWVWRTRDPFHSLPLYGDGMETVVGVTWFDEAIRHGRSLLIYPLNYFPEGWRVATHSAGMIIYVLLWPLYRLGGAAFAFNMAIVFSSLLAFAGAYLLARNYLSRVIAILPALMFTFGTLRWYQAWNGRMQILIGSVCLPWMLWCLERAFLAERRRRVWLALAGVLWALAFMIGQYFVFLGGISVAIWILFSPAGRPRSWTEKLADLVFTCVVFAVVSAPWLLLTLRESAIADPAFYAIGEVNFSGASLNSLPIPSLFHPVLGQLMRTLYAGEPWEQGAANLGLAMVLTAVAGAIIVRKDRSWRPMLLMTSTFLVLALGLTLHWSGQPVQWSVFRPLNEILWRLGHVLKPGFFAGLQPHAEFVNAVPLPGMLLTILVPFLERGRMFARYVLPASLGVYLLAGLVLTRLRWRWLQILLTAVLIIEFLPPPLDNLPYPPATHPAFEWLKQQSLGDQGILDTYAGNPSTLVLSINGETLLATLYHNQPTAGGSAGVVPRHAVFLAGWLASHPHTYWQPDFAQIMRSYRIRYVVMQMHGVYEQELWDEAKVSDYVRPVDCFDPPDGSNAWPWPICIVEIPPAPSPDFNVLWGDGWSGMEDWGVWAEGTQSFTQWIATARAPQRLSVAAFPQCLPDRQQRIELEVNGSVVATHQWQDCEPWSASVEIPVELVHVGANDLIVHADYASLPAGGGDPRQLSAGFTKLLVEPEKR